MRAFFDPSMIIGCVHAILNAFILCVMLYTVSYALYFMTVDILYKINSKKAEARVLMSEARRLYILNRCDPSTRVPALEQQCAEWDCVSRNGLSGIKYTRIAVEMCADVLDGFVSKFSLKSCSMILGFLVVYLLLRRR